MDITSLNSGFYWSSFSETDRIELMKEMFIVSHMELFLPCICLNNSLCDTMNISFIIFVTPQEWNFSITWSIHHTVSVKQLLISFSFHNMYPEKLFIVKITKWYEIFHHPNESIDSTIYITFLLTYQAYGFRSILLLQMWIE